MGKLFDLIKTYAIQPSTWRGLVAVIIGVFGFTLSQEAQEVIVQALVALGGAGIAAFGAIEVVRNEKKK